MDRALFVLFHLLLHKYQTGDDLEYTRAIEKCCKSYMETTSIIEHST